MTAVNVPRPTPDSKPFKALVVNALVNTDDMRCRHCGQPILACGFDCAHGGYVHLGKRAGSHKCGILDGYPVPENASP